MRSSQRTRKARPPGRSVHESPERQEERETRIADMIALARKHTPKAALRNSDAERIAHLRRMLADLCHEYELARDTPERARHLADAVRDLRLVIAREESSL